MKNSKNYLEFGAGGSTFLAVLYSNANIFSIESDINWINYLKEYKILNSTRVDFQYINIGKTGDWGYPIDETFKDSYYKYSSVFKKQKAKIADLVFIDGRFRVACALQTILHTSKDTIIAIHDFWNRECYHILLNYLDVIDKVETLGVFKKKENINSQKILDLYDEYKIIPE